MTVSCGRIKLLKPRLTRTYRGSAARPAVDDVLQINEKGGTKPFKRVV